MAVRRYLVLSVIGACLVVLAPAASAFAGSSTYYAGKNSQGQKLLFAVDQTATGPKFDPFFTTLIDRCPVTGDKIAVGFEFQGFRIPIKNGKFNLVLNDISDRFSWSGTVTSTKASGTESYALAAFDHQGGLQACTTGSLSWTAMALSQASSPAAAQHATYVVKVTKAADGSVRFAVTH
jgi:hypothetical protein